MKKFLAALLAISITVALTGCNKPAEEQTVSETTSGTASEVKVEYKDYDHSSFPAGKWADKGESGSYIYEFNPNGKLILLELEDTQRDNYLIEDYTFENDTLVISCKTITPDNKNYYNEFSFTVEREETGYRLYPDAEKSTSVDLPDDTDSGTELMREIFGSYTDRESFLLEYTDSFVNDGNNVLC